MCCNFDEKSTAIIRCPSCNEIRGNENSNYCEWCGKCFNSEYIMTGELIEDLQWNIMDLLEDKNRLSRRCKHKLCSAYNILEEVLEMYREPSPNYKE